MKIFKGQLSEKVLTASKIKKFKAFTLIEMIVVLVVVGIIATLGVSSYGISRRQAKLDIAVDSLISTFKEQSGKTKSGQRFAESGVDDNAGQLRAACFGVILDTTKEGNEAVVTAAMPYIGALTSQADVCDVTKAELRPSVAFDDIELLAITAQDQGFNQLEAFYKPPFGRLVMSQQQSPLLNIASLNITIGLKNTTDKRCFTLDTRTDVITRLLPQDCT